MQIIYVVISLFLLCTLVLGVWRILKGPNKADRMLTTQLFGTTVVAILLVTSRQQASNALIDLALIFALLSAITAVTFVFYVQSGSLEHDTD